MNGRNICTLHLEIPGAGPHGLDLDTENQRLFCARDAGKLFVIDLATDRIAGEAFLSGKPDVIFYNPKLRHLYVEVGDPGFIDFFDTTTLTCLEVIPTEKGAHTSPLIPSVIKYMLSCPKRTERLYT